MVKNYHTKQLISFKHWSRKSYAIFQSLKQQIRISSLSVALLIGFSVQSGFSQEQELSRNTEEEYDLDTLEVMSELSPELATTLSRSVQIIDVASRGTSSNKSIQDVLTNYSQIDLRQRGNNDVQSDLSLRGSTFDQVQVLFNGFDITDPQTGHHSLNIPIGKSQIRSVQLLSGPGSRVLGPNAYAGAVNILTHKPKKTTYDYDLLFGDFGLVDISLSFTYKKNKVGHYFAGNYSQSDGYTDNTDFKKYSLLYNGIYNSKRKELSWFAAYSDKAFGANSFYTPKYPNQFEQLRNAFVGVRLKTNGKISTSNQLHYRANVDRFELFRDGNQAAPWYSHHNYHFTQVLQYTGKAWMWSDFGKSTVTANIRNEGIYSNVLGLEMNDTVFNFLDDDAFYTKSDKRTYYTFAFEQVYYWKKMKIAAGLMYYYLPNIENTDGFYPGIDLSYDFSKKWRVFASANTGMRLPTFTDMYYNGPSNIGNPDLLAESQISYEIGSNLKGILYDFSASIYINDAKNSIDWVRKNDTVKWQPINVTNVLSYGTDLSFTIYPSRMNNSKFNWINNVSFKYSFIDKETSSAEYMSHYVMDYLKNKFVVNLNHKIYKSISIDYLLHYHQRVGQYLHYDADSKTETPQNYNPYTLLDIQLNWQFKGIHLYANISNVFNIKYQDYGNVIQPGRWFSLGVKKGIGK
jgi:iron complex outermembrane receptor protein